MTVQDQLDKVYKDLEPIFMKIFECNLLREDYVIEICNNGEIIFKVV